eukprot:SAG11_NODE_13627_length_646_cov_1.124314_1_plen_117_part_00
MSLAAVALIGWCAAGVLVTHCRKFSTTAIQALPPCLPRRAVATALGASALVLPCWGLYSLVATAWSSPCEAGDATVTAAALVWEILTAALAVALLMDSDARARINVLRCGRRRVST